MATYLSLVTFTEQGVRTIEESARRAASFKKSAKDHGIKIRDIFWTLGPFDGALLFEAADDETATAAMLHLSSLGAVKTQTTRAFTPAEFEKVVAKVAK